MSTVGNKGWLRQRFLVFRDKKHCVQSSCFFGGNASNSDARLIAALNVKCNLWLTNSQRFRCVGHIINFVVKSHEDSAEIEQMSDFLAHFYEMTRRLEGDRSKQVRIWIALADNHKPSVF